jgi:uncharacterized membrane protein YfcA
MSSLQIIFVVLTCTTGALFQGVAGLGLNLFAAPILSMIRPAFIPGPMMVGALLLVILITLRDKSGVDLVGIAWMVVGMLPGTALASWLLPVIPVKTLSLLLGILVLVGVALSLSGLPFQRSWWLLWIAGFVSGLGTTLASIGGPPVALANQDLEPRKLRATLSGYFLVSGVAALAGDFRAGRMGMVEISLSAWIVPGVVLGFLLSALLIRKLNVDTTRYAVLALSAASAVVLLLQQLLG